MILACAALAAAAAGPVAAATAGPVAAPPTRVAGVLTVGLSLPMPGFQTGAVRGTNVLHPRGMEVELARDIAAKLGLAQVRFYNVADFHDIYSPARKPYDLALAEVVITPARTRNVSFSAPYYAANQGVLLRTGLSARPTTIADLRKLTLCAETDTRGAELIRTVIRPHAFPRYAQTPDALLQLLQRRPLRRGDLRRAAPRRAEGQEARRRTVRSSVRSRRTRATASSSRRAARSALRVNAALRELIDDGTVSALARRYLITDVSEAPAPAVRVAPASPDVPWGP